MDIDLTQRPEVEYDDSAPDMLNIHWFSPDRKKMFSLVIRDGSLIGVNCTVSPARSTPWKVEIPKGWIRIDTSSDPRPR